MLRDLYLGWQPGIDQLRAILNLLGHGDVERARQRVVDQLLPQLPILGGYVLWKGWLDSLTPNETPKAIAQLERWLSRFCGTNQALSDSLFRQRMRDLLERASTTMSVDRNFVEDLGKQVDKLVRGERIAPRTLENIAVASNVGSFREFLTLRIVNELRRLTRSK